MRFKEIVYLFVYLFNCQDYSLMICIGLVESICERGVKP